MPSRLRRATHPAWVSCPHLSLQTACHLSGGTFQKITSRPPASTTPAWLPHPSSFPLPPPRAPCSPRLTWVEIGGDAGAGRARLRVPHVSRCARRLSPTPRLWVLDELQHLGGGGPAGGLLARCTRGAGEPGGLGCRRQTQRWGLVAGTSRTWGLRPGFCARSSSAVCAGRGRERPGTPEPRRPGLRSTRCLSGSVLSVSRGLFP